MGPILRGRPNALRAEDFLDLADFLADFPAHLLTLTLGFQVGIIRQLPCLLLDCALHFVNLTANSVPRAWLHPVTPSKWNRIPALLDVSSCDNGNIPSHRHPAKTQPIE